MNRASFCNRILATMLFLSLVGLHLQAKVYYVDAQHGKDSYSGRLASPNGSGGGPWRSIQKINRTRFVPGDSILFKRGEVWRNGPLVPANGGVAGATWELRDSVRDTALRFDLVDTIGHRCIYFGAYGEGEAPQIDCMGIGQGIILKHSYLIIEDFHVNNGENAMVELSAIGGNRWSIFKNIHITGCMGNAFRFSTGGNNIWIKNVVIKEYAINGIYLEGSQENPLQYVLVEDCHLENQTTREGGEDAISCHRDRQKKDIAGWVVIRNNRIIRSGEDGIDITSGKHILVAGNHIEHSYEGGIHIDYPWVSEVEVRNNILISNAIKKGIGDLTIGSPSVSATGNRITGVGHHSVVFQNVEDLVFCFNLIEPGERTGYLIWFRGNIGTTTLEDNIFNLNQTQQQFGGELNPEKVHFNHNCYDLKHANQEIFANKSLKKMQFEYPAFEPNPICTE